MGLLIHFHIILSKISRRQVHDILDIIVVFKNYIVEAKRVSESSTTH